MTGIGKKCGDPPHDRDFQKFACQKGVSTVEILRMTGIGKSVEILRMTGISKVTSYYYVITLHHQSYVILLRHPVTSLRQHTQ